MECYSAGEPVGNTPYNPIVSLLADRIDYEAPIQKSYMHQGYSFNYIGVCIVCVYCMLIVCINVCIVCVFVL